MASFLEKIKEKLFPKPDFDLEDDDDIQNNAQNQQENSEEEEIEDVEVDLGGPEIASAKKNKMAIIAASSLLITVVIYFLFFKEEKKKEDKLESVAPMIRPTDVTRSENGKSPFALEDLENKKDNSDISILDKPQVPDVPKLPEIPSVETEDGLILPKDLFVEIKEEAKPELIQNPQENAPIQAENNEVAAPIMPQKNQNPAPVSDPRYAPIIVLQGASGPPQGVGYENNLRVLNGDPINNLEKSQVTVKTSFIEDRSNVVAQGKFLSAVLETAINTEAQGSVRGIISRDVYGEAGSKVLIPRGSRIYGAYSTEVARGQSRVQINWTRLIRPDGVDLNISSFASDQFGRAGIEGIVDNKYSQAITNSLLTSLFAVAGAAIADSLIDNNQQNQTTTVDPNNGTATITSTATTQAVTDVTRNISDIASRFSREYFDARPTITVPQGTRVTILVNADIKMPPMRK